VYKAVDSRWKVLSLVELLQLFIMMYSLLPAFFLLLYKVLPGSVDETLIIEIKAIEQQLFTTVYFAVQGGLNFGLFRLET